MICYNSLRAAKPYGYGAYKPFPKEKFGKHSSHFLSSPLSHCIYSRQKNAQTLSEKNVNNPGRVYIGIRNLIYPLSVIW